MAANRNTHVNVKQRHTKPGTMGECLWPWRRSQVAAVNLNVSVSSHGTELSLDLVQTLPPQTLTCSGILSVPSITFLQKGEMLWVGYSKD